MSEISRRAILGTSLLAGAAGLGVGVGVATGHATKSAEPTEGESHRVETVTTQNPVLITAIERESALIERLRRAVAANPSLAASATVLRADHRAHLQALQALLLPAETPATSSSPGTLPTGTSAATAPSSPAATSPTATSPGAASSRGTPAAALSSTADLRRWESGAAAAAARDCTRASAQLAPLLASISACEASHAAWLA